MTNFMQVGNTISITVRDGSWTGTQNAFIPHHIEQYIIQLQQTVNELLERIAKLETQEKREI